MANILVKVTLIVGAENVAAAPNVLQKALDESQTGKTKIHVLSVDKAELQK